MAVDFYLTRGRGRRWRGHSQQNDAGPPLPEIDVHFAAGEFPRFLAKVAELAGIGDEWTTYHEMMDAQLQHIYENMEAIGRAAAQRAMGKNVAMPPAPPPADPRVLELRETLDAWQKAMAARTDELPILHFLLSAISRRSYISSMKCAAAAPALRAIAEQLEAAPEGRVGWREHALELSDAMKFAGEDGEVALRISK